MLNHVHKQYYVHNKICKNLSDSQVIIYHPISRFKNNKNCVPTGNIWFLIPISNAWIKTLFNYV